MLIGSALILLLTSLVPAFADHGVATLAGSNFEIDDDANLINDDGDPWVDWADFDEDDPDTPAVEGEEIRRVDAPTGQNDDSYKGGVKEDTECPNETTGSIPNNKSDLLTFHVYEEPGDPGFLNLAWSRVSDPSGTTLMDFEFNQSTTACPQGPNVVRTGDGEGPDPDDLLIEYAIDQGGARASISGRFWTGSEWGPAIDLTAPRPECGNAPCATGTINTSVIEPADSDGLTDNPAVDDLQPRTFGEAQIDLGLIFDEGSCTSFGSAMLKSRSSTSFTSQLKDFIRPVPIDLQNCGNVIIRKQTDPDGATAEFGYTKNFPTDPESSNTFTLMDDGVRDYEDTVLFGTEYTVTEDVLPDGWQFVNLDCSASSPSVNYVVNGATVTFDISSDEDELDCTYFNEAKGSITVAKVTDPDPDASNSDFNFDRDWVDNPEGQGYDLTLQNGGSETTGDLAPGTYSVTELDPSPWTLQSTVCVNSDGVDQGASNSLTLDAGEDITCTFTNQVRGQINVLKVDDADNPLEGVTFELFNDDPPLGGTFPDPADEDLTTGATCTTDAAGECSFSGVIPGDYWVVEDETTVPDGYSPADPQTASISVNGTLTVDLEFENPRQRGAILITKTRKHAAAGGDEPHAGVTFEINGPNGGLIATEVTDANGEICVDGLLVSALFEGDGLYSATETLPGGYLADQALTQDVEITAESTCGDGNEATVSFGNTPLTDVTVSVDSQVDGGTSSVITCWAGDDTSGDPLGTTTTDPQPDANGDGSLTITDLAPTDPDTTVTCKIVVDP